MPSNTNGKTPEGELRSVIDSEIKKLQTDLISDEDLQKLQNKFENQFVNQNSNIHSRAESLATYYALTGNTNLINKEIDIYRGITKEDIRNAARKYLNPNQRIIINYVPEKIKHEKHITYIAASFLISGIMTAQNIDINVMPKPGPTPVISIANPQSFKLSNGLTVLIVENHKLPRVNVTLSMDRPPVYEGNIAGVNGILASQLGNGTTTMSKDDFNKRVDFMGSTIRFSSSGAFANSLSKYFPETLALMADAAINPKFSQEEIQKSKERSLEGLKSNEKMHNL